MHLESSTVVSALNSSHDLHVFKPNSHSTVHRLTARGNVFDNNNLSWSFKPSSKSILKKRIYVRYQLVATLDNSGNNADADWSEVTLRPFPLNQCVTSATLTLNSTPFQHATNRFLPLTSLMTTSPEERAENYDGSPSQPDMVGNLTTLFAEDLISPGAQYGRTLERTRGSYGTEANAGPAGNLGYIKTMTYDLYEQIDHPLLNDNGSFSNLNDIMLELSLNLTVDNLFAGVHAGNLTVVTQGVPEMYIESYNGHQSYQIPPVVENLYTHATINDSAVVAINDGDVSTITIPNSYHMITPTYVGIFVTPARTVNVSTGLASIEKISLTINNTSGVLQNVPQNMLYQMSLDSGLTSEFTLAGVKNRGLPCIFKVGEQIPVSAFPNQRNTTFDIGGEITVRNYLGANLNFTCHVVLFNENKVALSLSGVQVTQGISESEVQNVLTNGTELPLVPKMTGRGILGSGMMGGFFNRRFWKDVGNTLKSKDFQKGFIDGFDGTLNRMGKVASIGSALAGVPQLKGGNVESKPSLNDYIQQGRM